MKISSAYFLMPLLALAGASCASDNHEPESPATVRSAWVSLDIAMDNTTRAMIDDPEDPSSAVGRINVYLTEGSDGNEVIKAVGVGDMNTKKFVDPAGKTTMNIKASIDAASPIETGKTYRLRVVANARMLNLLSHASVKETAAAHNDIKWNYNLTEFSDISRKGLPFDGMPMAAVGTADCATVMIEDGKGTENNPYTSTGNVTLTRMMSAIDYNPGTKKNEYEVEKHNVNVKFLSMQPVNVAKETYLVQRVLSTPAGLVQSPASPTLYGILPATSYTAPAAALQEVTSACYKIPSESTEHVCYVTENVPAKGDVALNRATGVIFTAKLVRAADTPSDIAGFIDGASHPDLAYFDDGTYQSGLMKYDSEKHKGSNWHLVKWETIKIGEEETEESGYMVRYLKTVRHGGITPDNIAPAGEDKASAAATDGKIDDMEYATVRGHRYVMRIAGVTKLPHPYHPDDTPEDGKGDIDIEVQVPTSWTYHRRLEELNNF